MIFMGESNLKSYNSTVSNLTNITNQHCNIKFLSLNMEELLLKTPLQLSQTAGGKHTWLDKYAFSTVLGN